MVKEEIDKFTSTSKRKSTSSSPLLYPIPTIPSELSLSSGALLIIDTLQPLTNNTTQHPPSLPLPTFLASLTSPSTSLLAIYHTDIPIPHPSSSSSPPSHHTSTPTTTTTPFYTPPPPLLLRYLATTLLATHSFAQTLSRKRAQDISGPIPLFGIEEGKDGVLVGMGANDKRGCVVEMEYRRKSGRGVKEWFFLSGEAGTGVGVGAHGISGSGSEGVSLLDDHPLFKIPEIGDEGAGLGGDMEMEKATFELGLSEKQRRDREGVVLPYLDAQRGEGGMGGRILYDLGVEDDFDEEEDEI